MVDTGMGLLGRHTNDRVRVIEIIIISIILTSIVLLPLGVTRSLQGVQEINVGQIGLPEKAVQELRNLLRP